MPTYELRGGPHDGMIVESQYPIREYAFPAAHRLHGIGEDEQTDHPYAVKIRVGLYGDELLGHLHWKGYRGP